MFAFQDFPADQVARYPDKITVAAPRGTRSALKRAAEAERVTVPELVRRAIDRVLAAPAARSEA